MINADETPVRMLKPAHGRRGFEEALHTTSDLLVHEALVWIQQLYDLEDRAREFSADERTAVLRKSLPDKWLTIRP